MSEWELLEITEEIEPGDTLVIEHEGVEQLLVFKKFDAGIIYMVDSARKTRRFRGTSLEEIGGSGFILRKSEEALSLK